MRTGDAAHHPGPEKRFRLSFAGQCVEFPGRDARAAAEPQQHQNSTVSFDSAIALLFLLGACQGGFLALALATSRAGPRRANRYLAAYLLVFVLALTDYALDAAGIASQHAWLHTLLWPKEFFYGVFIYFYVRELTRPNRFALQGRQWFHFAPAMTHVALTWSLLAAPVAMQRRIFEGGQPESTVERLYGLLLGNVELVLTIIHVAVYLVLAIRLLRAHERRVKANFSYVEKIGLRWLRRLLNGTLAIYGLWVAGSLVDLYWPIEDAVHAALGTGMVLLIYTLGFLALRQPAVFTANDQARSADRRADQDQRHAHRTAATANAPDDDEPAPPDAPDVEPVAGELADIDSEKYRNSALSRALAEDMLDQATRAMVSGKLYLDSALSLPQMAAHLGMSVNHLSQAINQAGGQNFFDYVSGFRVQAVIDRLDEPGVTVLDLAMDAGFNSKSAFYTAFKKHTGVTPGQFRKNRGRAAA